MAHLSSIGGALYPLSHLLMGMEGGAFFQADELLCQVSGFHSKTGGDWLSHLSFFPVSLFLFPTVPTWFLSWFNAGHYLFFCVPSH